MLKFSRRTLGQISLFRVERTELLLSLFILGGQSRQRRAAGFTRVTKSIEFNFHSLDFRVFPRDLFSGFSVTLGEVIALLHGLILLITSGGERVDGGFILGLQRFQFRSVRLSCADAITLRAQVRNFSQSCVMLGLHVSRRGGRRLLFCARRLERGFEFGDSRVVHLRRAHHISACCEFSAQVCDFTQSTVMLGRQ